MAGAAEIDPVLPATGTTVIPPDPEGLLEAMSRIGYSTPEAIGDLVEIARLEVEPAHRVQPYLDQGAGGTVQHRVVETVSCGGEPATHRWLDRLHRAVDRVAVAEQRSDQGQGRHPPFARLLVEVADLEIAPRPYDGEQGREVVVEIVVRRSRTMAT